MARIKGFVSVAYSYVTTLLSIIGWGGILVSLMIGALFGFALGYHLGYIDFFGHLPPTPPFQPS